LNRNILKGFLVAIVAGFLFFYIRMLSSDGLSDSYTQLWEKKHYSEIISMGQDAIEKNPLDKNSLVFMGYAYFYQGMNIVSMEERVTSIKNAVFMLRKALIMEDKDDVPILYILGKAYYHLGYYYTDLAIKYLEIAKHSGYDAEDLDEYLDLAYGRLGSVRKSS